jgi:FtsP/CotA-like multicopper oxidase with cupredoxin domain
MAIVACMPKPTLVSMVAFGGRDDSALLPLAASVARGLNTAVATAIIESANERAIQIPPVDEFHRATAAGVTATVGGHTVAFGDAAFFGDLGLSVEDPGGWAERLRRRGEQVRFMAVDGRTAGLFGVTDTDRIRTHVDAREEEMKDDVSTVDSFPNEVTDVPDNSATKSIELGDSDRFELRIAPVTRRLGDVNVRMLAYNGSIPGPALRVQQGSEVLVNVVNEGDLDATVHWHGLRLDNRYDGTLSTQSPIPVGGRFEYRLAFPDPGIYWYHPHIREDYGQEMGLYGTIIVTPSDPDYWPLAHREVAITLDDVLVEERAVAPFSRLHPTYTAMGRFGNVLLINGEPQLQLDGRNGEVVRLYLTNTANTRVFNVCLPGARMKLVGGDSGRVEHETFVENVVIAPSERAIVDVLFDRPGLLSLEHRTPGRIYTLATIDIGAERVEPSLTTDFERLRKNLDMTTTRTQIAPYLTAEPAKTLALVAEMNMPAPPIPEGAGVGYVCPMHSDVVSDNPGRCRKCGMKLVPSGLVPMAAHAHTHAPNANSDEPCGAREPAHVPAGIEWEDDMVEVNRMTNPANMRWKLIDRHTGSEGAAIDWRFTVGDQVKIRIVNEMDSDHPMHHPFHIHGAGRFVILSRDGVEEGNLVWKDTVLVRTGETVDILLDVTHPGVWMAHCHIAEHHESGMMLRFRVDQSSPLTGAAS